MRKPVESVRHPHLFDANALPVTKVHLTSAVLCRAHPLVSLFRRRCSKWDTDTDNTTNPVQRTNQSQSKNNRNGCAMFLIIPRTSGHTLDRKTTADSSKQTPESHKETGTSKRRKMARGLSIHTAIAIPSAHVSNTAGRSFFFCGLANRT